jgi:hypothetical protein
MKTRARSISLTRPKSSDQCTRGLASVLIIDIFELKEECRGKGLVACSNSNPTNPTGSFSGGLEAEVVMIRIEVR